MVLDVLFQTLAGVDNVFVCDSGFVRGLGQQCDRQVQSADGT